MDEPVSVSAEEVNSSVRQYFGFMALMQSGAAIAIIGFLGKEAQEGGLTPETIDAATNALQAFVFGIFLVGLAYLSNVFGATWAKSAGRITKATKVAGFLLVTSFGLTFVTLIIGLLFGLTAIKTYATPPPDTGAAPNSPGAIIVIDGDTISIGEERIRILGLNAPEIHFNVDRKYWPKCTAEEWLGHRARERLRTILDQGAVEIDRTGKDKSGQSLAHVSVDGESISEILIREGYAVKDWVSWCDLIVDPGPPRIKKKTTVDDQAQKKSIP